MVQAFSLEVPDSIRLILTQYYWADLRTDFLAEGKWRSLSLLRITLKEWCVKRVALEELWSVPVKEDTLNEGLSHWLSETFALFRVVVWTNRKKIDLQNLIIRILWKSLSQTCKRLKHKRLLSRVLCISWKNFKMNYLNWQAQSIIKYSDSVNSIQFQFESSKLKVWSDKIRKRRVRIMNDTNTVSPKVNRQHLDRTAFEENDTTTFGHPNFFDSEEDHQCTYWRIKKENSSLRNSVLRGYSLNQTLPQKRVIADY